MELLITDDVDTTDKAGERRLRRVAKICEGIGHRVQKSVFEVVCDPAQRVRLEAELLDVIDQQRDSVRVYRLGQGTFAAAGRIGAAVAPPHRRSLII